MSCSTLVETLSRRDRWVPWIDGSRFEKLSWNGTLEMGNVVDANNVDNLNDMRYNTADKS